MSDYALTPEQRQHFVEHGWLKIPQAIKPRYLDEWTSNLFIRLGWDPDDKSTWASKQKMGTYVKLPRHREVLASELAPKASAAMCEIVGGEDKIDPVRERYHGDQLIINFGNEYWTKHPSPPPHQLNGWHADNDWYRQFLDSSGNALTIIHLFSDVPPGGGGTWICEDGIERSCQVMYDNPDGWDPPDHDRVLHEAIKRGDCEKFVQIEGKAGDVFITHAMLPHAPGINHLWYPRIITNPHVNLKAPFNLNRPDGNYTLCENVILRALGRTSIPEWKPTRERKIYYPWTAVQKRSLIQSELDRMLAHAASQGLGPESVDSIYLQGDEALEEHMKRNGYDKLLRSGDPPIEVLRDRRLS